MKVGDEESAGHVKDPGSLASGREIDLLDSQLHDVVRVLVARVEADLSDLRAVRQDERGVDREIGAAEGEEVPLIRDAADDVLPQEGGGIDGEDLVARSIGLGGGVCRHEPGEHGTHGQKANTKSSHDSSSSFQ